MHWRSSDSIGLNSVLTNGTIGVYFNHSKTEKVYVVDSKKQVRQNRFQKQNFEFAPTKLQKPTCAKAQGNYCINTNYRGGSRKFWWGGDVMLN